MAWTGPQERSPLSSIPEDGPLLTLLSPFPNLPPVCEGQKKHSHEAGAALENSRRKAQKLLYEERQGPWPSATLWRRSRDGRARSRGKGCSFCRP